MYRGPRHGLIKPYGPLALDPTHPWTGYVRGAWFMQDGLASGIITDISGYKNNAALTNGASLGTGGFGQQLLLASANSKYANVASPNNLNPDSSKNITILARVKSTLSPNGAQAIICKQYDGANLPWMLNIGVGNAVENGMAVYTSGWAASNIVTDIRSDGKYHVVGGTCALNPGAADTTLSYFVDGKLDSSNTSGKIPQSANTAVQIGTYSNASWYFDGSLEFIIVLIGVALTAQEMRDFALAPYQMLQGVRTNQNFKIASNITLALTGNSSISHVGSLGVKNSQAISGNQSSSSIGSIAQKRTVPVTGNTASGIAGALSFGLTKAISGNAANGGIGSVSFGLSKALSGLQSNSSIGSVSYGVAKALTGNASVTGLGALSYALRLSTTGVHATGYAGTVTAPSGNITLAITGVHAVLSAGSISPSVAVNITGTEAVGGVGTLSHEMSLKLSGVQSSSGVGAVFAPFGIFSAKTQDAEATNCLSNDHELTNGSVQDGKITSITIEVEP